MSTANGKSLGMQLKPLSATDGCGLAIHAVDAGGQAEAAGSVYAGDVVTHVNGTDVMKMPLGKIAALIKSNPTCTLRLVTAAELKALTAGSAAPQTTTII